MYAHTISSHIACAVQKEQRMQICLTESLKLKECLVLMLDPNRYSVGAEFAKHPIACLTLASYLPSNTGDVARKHIRDPELLSFIDIECYCWSTVLAEHTPMINAGMVCVTCLVSNVQSSSLSATACDEHLKRPYNARKACSMLGAPKILAALLLSNPS